MAQPCKACWSSRKRQPASLSPSRPLHALAFSRSCSAEATCWEAFLPSCWSSPLRVAAIFTASCPTTTTRSCDRAKPLLSTRGGCRSFSFVTLHFTQSHPFIFCVYIFCVILPYIQHTPYIVIGRLFPLKCTFKSSFVIGEYQFPFVQNIIIIKKQTDITISSLRSSSTTASQENTGKLLG